VIDVRSATPADIEACSRVLARAFQDDPGTMVFEPDPDRRRAILPVFFRTWVAAALADGDLVVPARAVDGLASWFGPGSHAPSDAAMTDAGFAVVIDSFGPAAMERMGAMVGELEAQHARLMGEAHLRLEFFGVDPEARGRGIGGALADHGHDRADTFGLPCYLETFTQRNVAWYEKRGYRVLATYLVGDDVPVYGMRREPQT